MAYTLEEIYLTGKEKYSMDMLAGAKGIKAAVSWVHMVETVELVPFLKRRELVITTGIRNQSADGLVDLAQQLKEKGVAGLIINVGPYIEEVPENLIAYCEEVDFPLFSLPWEVRLVEFSHDMCRSIILDENNDEDIAEAFLDGMLFPAKRDESRKILSRHGFGPDTVFQLFVCMIADGAEEKFSAVLDDLYYLIESILNKINNHYILFVEKNMVYVVLADYNPGEVKLFARKIGEIELHYGYRCYCGVNPATSDFEQLAQYFDKSEILLRLAKTRHISMAYYENLEIYKLLLSVSNMEVLEEYHRNTVGLLKQYDKLNQTNLFSLLCQYFSHDGRIQDLAEENFVHRNTIHYQLAKVEKIMGIRLENWDDRVKIHLSLLIDEIL